MKAKTYNVISAETKEKFADKLNDAVKEGYELLPETFKVNDILTSEYEGTHYYAMVVKQ